MNSLEPILDFDFLETYDLRVLRLADMSSWEHLENEPTYVDIITPGRKSPVTHFFRKNKINLYNSNLLELTCDTCEDGLANLPDGIYKIKIYVCEGEKFYEEKNYLRTTKALLRLDQVLISMALNCCLPDKTIINKYLEIELLIKSAHANLRDGNINQTACEFEKALDLLEQFESCVKCEIDLTCKTSSCK